jgi:hypothetical protein
MNIEIGTKVVLTEKPDWQDDDSEYSIEVEVVKMTAKTAQVRVIRGDGPGYPPINGRLIRRSLCTLANPENRRSWLEGQSQERTPDTY